MKTKHGIAVAMALIVCGSAGVSRGQDDPIAYAKQEIQRLDVLWNPVTYASVVGVYKIGGGVAMAGGTYVLLASPDLAVDLVSGGWAGVASGIGKDAMLSLIENMVQAPRVVCRDLSRSSIAQGWKEYQTAYDIARRYRRTGLLSRDEAVTFLKARFGADRMTIGRVLYEQSAGRADSSLPAGGNAMAEQLVGSLTDRLQRDMGVEGPLPLAKAAFFIRDAVGILKARYAGLAAFTPYTEFSGKMAAIDASLLREATRFAGRTSPGNAGPATPETSGTLSSGRQAPTVATSAPATRLTGTCVNLLHTETASVLARQVQQRLLGSGMRVEMRLLGTNFVFVRDTKDLLVAGPRVASVAPAVLDLVADIVKPAFETMSSSTNDCLTLWIVR